MKKEGGDKLTIDQVLQRVGEFGRFQKLLDGLFFIMNIPVAYQILITYFATLTPSWKCHNGSTSCVFGNNITAMSPNDYRRCDVPRTEWSYTEQTEYSIVTEFKLDCGKEWVVNLISSVYFLGWGSGGIVLGWVGDRYGRKMVLFPSIMATLVAGFITPFCRNLYIIIVLRYLIGFFNPGSTLQAFILISEYVGSRQRPFAGIVVYLSLPVGYIIVAIKAYLTQNWKLLYIISTAPYFLVVAFYRFVPESVKWLLLHGRTEDVKETIGRIGKWNGAPLDDNVEIQASDEILVAKTNIFDIFRTRTLMWQSVAQAVVWLVTGIAYFGLSLAADDLGGSPYRDFIILSVFELPALALAIDLCTRFGRKPTTLVPLLFGGIASIVVVSIPTTGKLKVVRVLSGIIGKFCLSITFDAVYTWSVEIYPTSIRSKGMGFLQATSHIGSAAAPWIAKGLKSVAIWLPFVAMGIPALIGALIGIWLPETKLKREEAKPAASYESYGVTNEIEIDDTKS